MYLGTKNLGVAMRLASFEWEGESTWGVVQEEGIADLGAALGRNRDLRSALRDGLVDQLNSAARTAPCRAFEAVRWLPVIPNPGKILCIGLNYETHRQETSRPKVDHPTVFTRFADSQAGHHQNVAIPRVCEQFDYEGELAVIIGKHGRYIPRDQALQHIAGYACYNDFSARDWQYHTHQFTPGKNFPGTGGFGPWLVTPDEVGALDSLRLQTRLNGNVMQSATLGQMIFDVPALIDYCSSFTPLEPGDVIVTGTPGGVGAKRNPPIWLQGGDSVEVEIDGVGVLRNRIVHEPGEART
jgi:2-keto-4-pentenoate hydratase/2-oxohepta-3-ene-1,7-dioic acid hydratase in catechol pathway